MYEVGHGVQVLEITRHLRIHRKNVAWIFDTFKIVLLHLFKILHYYFALRLYCLEKP